MLKPARRSNNHDVDVHHKTKKWDKRRRTQRSQWTSIDNHQTTTKSHTSHQLVRSQQLTHGSASEKAIHGNHKVLQRQGQEQIETPILQKTTLNRSLEDERNQSGDIVDLGPLKYLIIVPLMLVAYFEGR